MLDGSFVGFAVARGWPGEDAVGVLRRMLEPGGAPVWFVLLDGVVVGECGMHGPPVDGSVEIHYGVVPGYRGRGLGTEACRGLTEWLLARDGVCRVEARTHAAGNAASRRVLERAGFALAQLDRDMAWYVRER